MNRKEIQKAIESGKTVLGIEFGSTRIKAVRIGEDHTTIASGGYGWENQYENGVWTYSLEDVWMGLQESYRALKEDVSREYGTVLKTLSAIGFSGMMQGYMAFDKDETYSSRFELGELPRPRGQQRNSLNFFNSTFPIVGALPTSIRRY